MNPLYNEMMGSVNQNNPIQMLSQLQSNPVSFLIKRGFNVPQNIGNDPNSITQYLLNSGQISQNKYNQTVQMVQNNYNQIMQMAQMSGQFRH